MKFKKLNIALLLCISACCSNEMDKANTFEYIDIKVTLSTNKKNADQVPMVSLNDLSCQAMVTKKEDLGDTVVSIRRCFKFTKELEVPSPVSTDPIKRIDLYANRPFDSSHPAGSTLNSFLFIPDWRNEELPKNIEVWNQQMSNNKNLYNLLLIGAPDTIKGLTLFEWVLTKRSGKVLKDSTWVILE